MAEAVEANPTETRRNLYHPEKYDEVVNRQKAIAEIDDQDYDKLIDEAEKKFGMKFMGDREMAKFYMDEFLSGVVFSLELKGKKKLAKKVRLGISFDPNNSAANAKLTKDEYRVVIDFRTLEDLTFFDSDEEYSSYYNGGDINYISKGPAWFFAREMGVEEGAHIAFVDQRKSYQIHDEIAVDSVEYHQTDVEFDGLMTRIIDTELLLEDPTISDKQKFSISKKLNEYKRILRGSHEMKSRKPIAMKRKYLS